VMAELSSCDAEQSSLWSQMSDVFIKLLGSTGATIAHTARPVEPLRLFCACTPEDVPLLQNLKKHLAPLVREGTFTVWSDNDASPGADFRTENRNRLLCSDIALLLLSADSFASDYYDEVIVRPALQLHAAGQLRLVPVIARPVDWDFSEFRNLRMLPTDRNP